VRERTPEAVIAMLVAALVAGGLLAGGSGDSRESDRTTEIASRVGTIARRVEAIRGLRFARRPIPRVVSRADARRAGVAELDRLYPEPRRRADEELLALLGLVKPGTDLREVEASLFEGQVLGYYDTRKARLTLVRGAAPDPVTAEMALAHELTHALEDDRFGLQEPAGSRFDADTAYTALVEGTATALMVEYERRHVPPGEALGSALGALGASGGVSLPPYLRRTFEFPYIAGKAFVERLHRTAGGWKLVNYALRARPPASTEQVLHPEKYLAAERPRRVSLNVELPDGWRRVARGTIGELDTRELLRVAGDPGGAAAAAEGWGGGAFELWRRGPLPDAGCPSPCRRRDALVVAWKWDSARDRREFERELRRYAAKALDGGAAIASRGSVTSLALAPSSSLARLLSRAARP
jgi:hypothetical protein